MEIKTRIRRTHLGIHYDVYLDETYSATAHSAKELAKIIEYLEQTYA